MGSLFGRGFDTLQLHWPARQNEVKACKSNNLQAFTFLTNSYSRSQHKLYCFDDLGTENHLKFYDVECNVMAEILLSRYDQFCIQGLQTHLTTNLTSMDIEEQYGKRVRSRMREMFNLLAFDAGSRDKRF